MASDKKWDYTQYPGSEKYPNLFKPIKIRNLEIPNRIKYAATGDNLTEPRVLSSDDVTSRSALR